jgi:sulfite exporter TauE/SafE/copper chaperone CopZ
MQKKDLANLKEHVYRVEGMHCPSCELLLEKELLKKKGVESVEASTNKAEVAIFYQGQKPSLEELNKEFKKSGYSFSQKTTRKEKESIPLISFNKKGQLIISKPKLFSSLKIIVIVFLLLAGFFLLSQSGLAARVVVSSASGPSAFFLFGLVAGTSSCAALIGGLVLSMSKQWSEAYSVEGPSRQKLEPHLLFNFGRLVSFALLGAYLGAIGSRLQTSLLNSSFLTLAVSLLMILLAFQMLGFKRFQKFSLRPPKFFSRFVANEKNFKTRFAPALLGALTFFLPCGFTITAQGLALASGNAFQGFVIMTAFALGTLPMLILIGFSSLKLSTKPHLSQKFLKVAAILVLFFGLYNLNSLLNVYGLPSLNDVKLFSTQKKPLSQSGFPPILNGQQVLKMDALAYGYEPNEFKVKAGIPVRWEIKNKGVSGCTNAIVSKGLFDGEIRLDQGLSVKEFTPRQPGRYKFSCWMGMISGVINVVDPSLAGADQEATGLPVDNEAEIPSGVVGGCGGESGESCTGGCGGGCGNPGCPYAR